MDIGFPKIPDSREIASMTAEAMQPMMGKLDRLIELLEQQNAFLVAQAHRRRQT